MNGQMKKYKESLQHTPDPILLSQLSQKVDLKGLIRYARSKGMKVAQLSEHEKRHL